MENSGDFISMRDQDIVREYETRCYQFDPESKRQSMAWCSTSSPRPKIRRLQKSKVKTMLIAFFDSKGISDKQFDPAGQTINAYFARQFSTDYYSVSERIRSELHRTGKWMLLHDNVPAHSAIGVRQLLTQKMVAVLDHPPYCPNMATADFLLFPRLKAAIKVHFCGRECHQRSCDSRSAHSPSFTSLHLRHSSFSNPFVASPTSQALHFEVGTMASSLSPTLHKPCDTGSGLPCDA